MSDSTKTYAEVIFTLLEYGTPFTVSIPLPVTDIDVGDNEDDVFSGIRYMPVSRISADYFDGVRLISQIKIETINGSLVLSPDMERLEIEAVFEGRTTDAMNDAFDRLYEEGEIPELKRCPANDSIPHSHNKEDYEFRLALRDCGLPDLAVLWDEPNPVFALRDEEDCDEQQAREMIHAALKAARTKMVFAKGTSELLGEYQNTESVNGDTVISYRYKYNPSEVRYIRVDRAEILNGNEALVRLIDSITTNSSNLIKEISSNA